jgi:ABC-2 type transport system ATP-binding protein
MTALQIDNLCSRYKKFALGPLDLQLEPGIVLGLIGANGAGKSTLFRSLVGTVRPNFGGVSVCGVQANSNNSNWKQVLGYVGDTQVFFESWSALKNLETVARFYSNWSPQTALSLSKRFDLDLSQKPKHYSTGERTKLGIVMALAIRPKLLLLDEPTAGLDVLAQNELADALFNELPEDCAVIYATHHLQEIEKFADELVFIRKGQLLERCVKDELMDNWRRISFRGLEKVPNIADAVECEQRAFEYQLISRDYKNTVTHLKSIGAQSIELSRLSLETIGVHILKQYARGGE